LSDLDTYYNSFQLLARFFAKNPATLEEPRKDGQRSRFLLKKIWPQGCEKPDASNVRFERPLASLSPVAKPPSGATFPFLHFPWQTSYYCGFFKPKMENENSEETTPAHRDYCVWGGKSTETWSINLQIV